MKIKMYCPICFRVWNVLELNKRRPLSCVRCSFKTGISNMMHLKLTPFEMIKEKNVYKS